MVVADKAKALKEKIYQLIDALPDGSLEELASFVDYLQFKSNVPSRPQGSPWAKEFYDLFASAREAQTEMSETEINQLIDEELAATRHERND